MPAAFRTGRNEPSPQEVLAAANRAARDRAQGRTPTIREAANALRNRDDRATVGMAGYREPWERAGQGAEGRGEAADAAREAFMQSNLEGEGDDALEGDDGGEQGVQGGEPKLSQLARARELLLKTGKFTEADLSSMSRMEIKQAARRAQRKLLKSGRKSEASGRDAGGQPEQNQSQETLQSERGAPQSRVPAPRFDESKLDKRFETFDEQTKAALKAALKDVVDHFEARENTGEQLNADAAKEVEAFDLWEDARESVRDSVPEIDDDDDFEEALPLAKQLEQTSAYQAMRPQERRVKALQAAATALGFESVGESAHQRDARRAGRGTIGKGSMTPQKGGGQPSREQMQKHFMYLGKHPGDIEGARRYAGLA